MAVLVRGFFCVVVVCFIYFFLLYHQFSLNQPLFLQKYTMVPGSVTRYHGGQSCICVWTLGCIQYPYGLDTCSVCSWTCYFLSEMSHENSRDREADRQMRFAGQSAEELSKSERESCMESCVKPRDFYCSGSSILLTFEAVHVMKHLLWRAPGSKDENMKQLPLHNAFFHFFLHH